MSDKLTFIFDRIDPEHGLIPNTVFEPLPSIGDHTYERFLKKTFSNYEVQFKPTYFVDNEFGWLYPIFLNNLIYLNSIRHIKEVLPRKIRIGLYKKRGKIIIFVLEPLIGNYELVESLIKCDTPDYIYCTHHTSSVPNIINYDATILELDEGKINDKDVYEEVLTGYDNRRFSCFLYYYMDCPSRLMFLSFLEKSQIIDDTFISAKDQGKDFDMYLESMQSTNLGSFYSEFCSFEKVFDTLNIVETFEKSLIHITFEAEILYSSPHQVLTEKVYRCVEAEMPFILFSHPNALKYYRYLGFKSFSPFINENYDTEKDPKKRISMILLEIKRLSEIPIDELTAEINKLKPIFEHNKKILALNHLKTQTSVYKELHNGLQQ